MVEHPGASPLLDIENRLCPGCKRSAVNETGGLVVAFGQSFFHVDCFKCAKCNNKVTADTNLLLLSDGSPICAECSYNCNICSQPILDEAIMTGDDSYHAHCFKCKVCRNRIDELVFAKTSHGIYCMNCHNDRMAKIRRHAQRKREKEKAATASAPSSARDRDFLSDNTSSERPQNHTPPQSLRSQTSALGLREVPSTQSLHVSVREVTCTPNRRSPSPADHTSSARNHSTVSTPTERQPHPPSTQPSQHSQPLVVTVAPPDSIPTQASISPNGQLKSAPANLSVTSSLLTPPSSAGDPISLQRRKSYDDGVRPLNVLLANSAAIQNKKPSMGGLSVPTQTTRTDKRRSINPGLTLQFKSDATPHEMVRSQTLPVRSDLPLASSPSDAYFDDSVSRRSSNASLLRDNASETTIYHSPSSSPALLDNGRASPEPPRVRSVSHDPHPTPTSRPTTPFRSPRPIVTLDRLPKRSDSLRRINSSDGTNDHTTNGRLAPTKPPRLDGSKSEKSPPLAWNGDRTGLMTPASPSHPADVPHGVESGTDTEAESSNGRRSDDDVDTPIDSPPLPPPKLRPEPLNLTADSDTSTTAQQDGSNESSPVERTSIATFIAPALPPIRFSMSGADFSDFLKSVGGIPSLKSLDEIARQEETPSRSPTSINTLIPQDEAANQPSDVVDVPHSEPTTSHSSVAPPSSANDTGVTDTVLSVAHQPCRGRAVSESKALLDHDVPKRERLDSSASLNIPPSTTHITITPPAGTAVQSPIADETHDLVLQSLQEALSDANTRGSQQLRFEKVFVETILMSLEQRHRDYVELKDKYDKTKRASEQYMDGLTTARKEYDRELVARRNLESEIIRLRVLLSGHIAKLTTLTGETSRREAQRQMSEELSKNLDRLEKDLSKLKAERDVTLAEVEELCSSKSASGSVATGHVSAAQLSRSLTMRLDNIKKQYQHELVPLTQQRETLIREIAELKSAREQFLEETTVLNARNEELAQLSTQYTRRVEVARSDTPPAVDVKPTPILHEKKSTSFDRGRPTPEPPSLVLSSLSTGLNPSTSTLVDDREIKMIRIPRTDPTDATQTLKHGIFKWPGHRMKAHDSKGKGNFEHNFQPASALRFTRCDHCGDKLWGGSHFRCMMCHINVHSRCVNQVHLACSQHPPRPREDLNGIQPSTSIFGRDLADQIRYDLRWGDRKIPVIVEKCIDAVEALALDFEGIYRKTGGSGQTKTIIQLFDQGDYSAFDLKDIDRFNDICSVTSVLKTYFRSLPVPLLTYDLHEEFIAATGLKDPAVKMRQLQELVSRLPPEHYYTLRFLVLHLYHVREHCDTNLMNARNLGVVFGPTLMWSRDPGSEFSDMAGKALMIEWLVENAPTLFRA